MKFFVPSEFDKNAEAVKFERSKNANEHSTGKAKKNKKKNKKNKNKTNDNVSEDALMPQGKGPLAPKLLESRVETAVDLNSVKKGKIEKKKNKKQQKLTSTPALSKAMQEAIALAKNEQGDDMDEDVEPTAIANSFQAKLKEQLKGGRFRFLNEQLYTMNSKKAENLFKQEPDAFEAYHDGYRHQVEKWPLNPLDRIIKMIKKLPKSLEIGDFGCGEGKLAKSVPHKVISMDLVSCRDDIIACDMAETPLTTQSLDVAVYCLSLMGTNLKDCLLEANRVLKIDGLIFIAEIQSRFDNFRDFIKNLEIFGFKLVRQDVGEKVFYFFQFKKVCNVGKVAKVPEFSLKPCLYRKR